MDAETLLLCGLAFLAGLVDAIAGGGGLIQIPALFAMLPTAAPAALLGTNKLAASAGTAMAALRYARALPDAWRVSRGTLIATLTGGALGAVLASHAPEQLLRLVVLLLLIGALAQTLAKPWLGVQPPRRRGGPGQEQASAGVLGLYDGIAGPGTGSLFVYLYVRWFGRDFLSAAATAKRLNLATNVGALAIFIVLGNVDYSIGLPMLAANLAGGYAGATLAIRRGAGFVRQVFVLVVLALIGKMALEILG